MSSLLEYKKQLRKLFNGFSAVGAKAVLFSTLQNNKITSNQVFNFYITTKDANKLILKQIDTEFEALSKENKDDSRDGNGLAHKKAKTNKAIKKKLELDFVKGILTSTKKKKKKAGQELA